jgi:serine/threonine-protein kinase
MAADGTPPAGDSPIGAGRRPDQNTLADRYTLGRELGSGGMAVVYQAHDARHDREVAVKVLDAEASSLIGPDRFVREIRVAARLNHPGIVPVYDSGESDSCLFYVMPYVEGESLRGRLDREGRIPVDEAVSLIRDVASALAYAHARGVVHRDIKPENILLHQGVPMLMDFGIAVAASAAADTRLTRTGLLVGTPRYMSPEQAVGERELDARSDQYSLACVLYEMISGRAPHEGATARAVMARRITEPVPDMSPLRGHAPPGIERALSRALSAEPPARFESVIAFAEALTAQDGPAPAARSVAVLPFLNLSADPENEYFADGITEDVIAQLSRIGELKVISRTSVMAFKHREQGAREIAGQLNVATLLDGSVRRAGERVRIVAHLIEAATDRHLWSATYDRDLADIFAIQTDVAVAIADALKAELTPQEKTRLSRRPTENLEAYQLYLRARHGLTQLSEKGLETTIAYLEQAIALDPGYAMAYATLAYAYAEAGLGVVSSALKPAEAYRLAREAATKAMALDPNLAEAHTMLGLIKFSHDFDYEGAEREFKRALEIDPRSGDALDLYGRLLGALERYDEALGMQRRAHEVDPLEHRLDLMSTLLRAGRYDEALPAAQDLVEKEPFFGHAHTTLGWTYILMGRHEEGVAALRHALSLYPENDMYRAQLGQALGMTGDTEGAERTLQELLDLAERRYVSPYHVAYVYTGLGDHERAMDCLEQAYEERGGGLYGIKGSFLFRDLRSHPRFQALLGRMNLA